MDALEDERSRSGYAPTTPLMSEHEGSDILAPLPPDLLSVPAFNSVQGDLGPMDAPSPFASTTSVINQVDARTLQQAVIVNQDQSAAVAQVAEPRHQAIMSEAQNRFNEEATRMREDVERQARDFVADSSRANEQQAHERLRIAQQQLQQQQEEERKKMLTQTALEKHEYAMKERAVAQGRENSLRAELAEQARIIKELREGMNSAPGNRMSETAPKHISSSPEARSCKAASSVPRPSSPQGNAHQSDADSERSEKKKKKKSDRRKKDDSPKRGRSPTRKRTKKKSPSPPPSDSSSSDADSSSSSSVRDKISKLVKKELKKMLKKDSAPEKEKRAKEADKVLIPKFPTPERYRDWKIKVRDNVSAASAKPDDARKWIGKVLFQEDQKIDALADSEGFPTLDAKLLASLTNCAEGDLGRQIATFKELQARENKPVKGRQVLLKFHEYFATSIKHGAIYDLEDLASVKLVNDDLKSFISKWDSVLAGMKREPEQSVLEAYFHMAIKNFRPLTHDLVLYDRAAEGSKEKTYDFLIARAYLERKRLDKMRDATKRSLGGKDPVAPAKLDKKGVCFEFQKTGKCKRGSSCPFKHEKPREDSKGKGKGKSRGRSQSRSLTPGSRKEICKFWKAGSCHRGKDCAFQRPEKTVPAKEDKRKKKKKKEKPRKRSKSGRKVENLLLPMHRQPFASCGHWSLLQRSHPDHQLLSIARWEAWSCRHTLPCLF